MASRTALASAGCSSCRSAVLRLFAADFASPAPLSSRLAPELVLARRNRLGPTIARPYSTPARRPESSADTTGTASPLPKDVETVPSNDQHEDVSQQSSPGTPADSVPWYLQVEPPRHIATLEPPPLPPVPADGPPILSSILEYAAEELGLDELALLDLRELDPAPALGTNLFMLFGTARSERHLHVSAGRFVRWLRAKHRVHADADGLLGPNERKTKLRRKARKAKLLQIMGTDETDDGIRTGWICVNLGTIGRSGPEKANLGEDGRLTGFGTTQEGTSIVFQIMTEARRAEMNLEALWLSSLEKSRALSKPAETPALDATVQSSRAADALQTPARPTLSDGQVRKISPQQTASFSTVRANKFSASLLGRNMASPPSRVDAESASSDAEEKSRVLGLLHNFLRYGPPEEIAKATGGRPGDNAGETDFTRLYDGTTAELSPAQSWACRLTFHAKCVDINPNLAAHKAISQKLLQEMQLHGISATREQYLELLGAICRARYSDAAPSRTDLALSLLQTMHQRGQEVLANDVVVSMLDGAFSQSDATSDSPLVKYLWDLLAQTKQPCLNEKSLIHLLKASVEVPDEDYAMLWNVWELSPRHLQARSYEMYLEFFRTAMQTCDANLCGQVIRRCLLDMPHERPAVALQGRLSAALRECINVADPAAEQIVARLPPGAINDIKLTRGREFVIMLLQLNAAEQQAAL
ncbi:uncharacterized protein B0I36DRAFT_323302 [Microdochium trichocladiopsis]|uniref:ATPase synthesis protein 25 n=1 Tax=Microdochium trichocladiopsis TaxID=1682393 RepID=A0A9P9BND7_9PEZI|nr:uncharacterized protein B0I36DRAFT_323302 [Microdochium trichocladiopsis]KAH7031156.1 hypothetical protein B0I36DRAFT_323302 [Microdochium trichocladiopsis]